MSDAHTAAKALLLAACRDSAVAAEASIDPLVWMDRVQVGDKGGFIAGLHRGRLPAIEVFQKSDKWTQISADGGGQGTMSATWMLRVHSGLPDQDMAEDQCRAITYAALIKIRAQQYFFLGDDIVSAFDESPLGYSLSVELEVITAMGRDTYETTPAGSGGTIPTGGVVGGISIDINWNDTSPKGVLSLPSGQAVNGVQVKVLTAFDGTTPTISVGIIGDQERYMSTADSDLTLVDTVWEKDVDDAGPKTIYVWIEPGVGATAGVVRVQIPTTGSV